jgi:hypothetical protein
VSRGSLIPGPRYAEQPERLVWVAFLQQPGKDGMAFMQKLEDMDHETRSLISGDLLTEHRRVWGVRVGDQFYDGLQLLRVFQTTDGQFQQTLRELAGETLQ